MKKIFVFAALISVLTTGCLKDDSKPCKPKTLEQDMPGMTKFAADHSINTTKDESGILYEIINPGSDKKPNVNSKIVAKYVGLNLSGVQFDSGQFSEPYALSGLIEGWQIILQKIGEGGKMKMIIPSGLAYKCYAPTQSTLNQPLYFDVELISVN